MVQGWGDISEFVWIFFLFGSDLDSACLKKSDIARRSSLISTGRFKTTVFLSLSSPREIIILFLCEIFDSATVSVISKEQSSPFSPTALPIRSSSIRRSRRKDGSFIKRVISVIN